MKDNFKMKKIITILWLSLTMVSCGQTTTNTTQSGDFKALAKLVSLEGGDKVHFAKFKIIKDLSDTLILKDTIVVGFYNYKQPDDDLDYVLLTLKKYDGQTSMKNYFICPDYDGKMGIQKVKIDFIDPDYWEGCETGQGECKPLTFTRPKTEKNWFLIMPCGGTETAISISGQGFSKELHLYHDKCPPYLDLTDLADGTYSASMLACGLGGTVNFILTTQ